MLTRGAVRSPAMQRFGAHGMSLAAAALVIFMIARMMSDASAAVAQESVGSSGIWQLPAVAPMPAVDQARPARSCESLSATPPSQSLNVVTVWLALPIENWNDRFLGLGGGGWIPGFPVTAEFYGHALRYSYFSGCSTGVADDIIPVAGSIHYVEAIRERLGVHTTNTFLRFYLAPGVEHCGGGDGPHPVALLEPLMDWVEHGYAPRAVRGEIRDVNGRCVRTRPLCPYPQRAYYRGSGSVDDATNCSCR